MTRLPLLGAALAFGVFSTGCSSTMPAAAGDGTNTGSMPAPVADIAAPCENGAATLPDGADAGLGAFDCSNVDLVAFVPLDQFDARQLNDIWGWTDAETGKEYALVGLDNGTFFVDISMPSAPVMLGKLPTQTVATVWRDIKVYEDHAFIVSEARDHGMQVFDLTHLRGLDEDATRTFEADAHYDKVTNVHNIVMNEDTGFAYAVGYGSRGADLPPECGAPGFHVINVQDPKNPTFAGCFSDASKDTSPVSAPGYTHDAQCVTYSGPDADYTGREICVGSNEDVVTIFDATDKDDVRIVSMAAYPGDAYTHQNWFTEDQSIILANDELDEQNGNVSHQRTLIFDVTDLDEPEYIGAYDSGIETIDHNLYIRGNLSYQSNYESGLRILDISDAASGVLREVAHFDTYPQDTSINFAGQWSNFPYFGSGMVIASDTNNGLFILRPTVDPN